MVIGNRLKELRDSKTLSRGDIEKRKRTRWPLEEFRVSSPVLAILA